MKDDKYEIEGNSPTDFGIFVVRRGEPRLKICTAHAEPFCRIITIALMELDKNSRGIDWGRP